LAGAVRLKTKFLTINLVAYAVDLVKQVFLVSRNNVEVCLKKVGETQIGHVVIG
jgi:hypothetical protein